MAALEKFTIKINGIPHVVQGTKDDAIRLGWIEDPKKAKSSDSDDAEVKSADADGAEAKSRTVRNKAATAADK